MRKIIVTLLLLVSVLSACNPNSAPALTTPTITSQPVVTRQPLPTASPTETVTSTSTTTATLTPSPTATPVPTATPTPLGGGSGVVLLRSCSTWDDCSWSEFSLHSIQLHPLTRPYFKSVRVDQDPYKWRLDLYNPSSGETKTILECPADYANCSQHILSGSLEDDWLFLSQKYNKQRYDGNSMTELYRLETASQEATFVDQFEGDIYGFIPLEGSSQVLMSSLSDVFRGELLIYDLETLERRTIISRMGQFYRIGITPDENVFYYRITDYCETELVTREGNRIPAIKNSDGILGWIDEEIFLVFTASNNPPICTRTGIALANRYGLTGEWITDQPTQWAILSPDGQKVFYTTDCNSQGCTKLMVANLDGSNSTLILESPERQIDGKFSPDGSKLLLNAGKQIWMVNSDGSEPRLLVETEDVWQVTEWPE